jgi:hypothetical protein
MALNGSQLEALQNAILAAYDYPALEQCLFFRLNISLPQIVANSSFRKVVFDFLRKMEQEGKTAGVVRSLKDDRPENREFVAVCDDMLRFIGGTSGLPNSVVVPPPAGPSVSRQRTTSAASVDRSKSKMNEIQDYLRRIAGLLPTPDPEEGLLSVLRPILTTNDPDSQSLRAAFGFPKDGNRSASLYELVASAEPSMQPVLGVLSQRVNTLMWRLGYTLIEIKDDWAGRAKQVADDVIDCCDRRLVARQPTLLAFSGSQDLDSHLEAVGEPAPDMALYAALRAIDHAQYHELPIDAGRKESLKRTAFDFLFRGLSELVAGRIQVEDSSNAWWAVRIGICAQDERFLGLLPGVSAKFNQVIISATGISRLAATPEIYMPIRTQCYTLSNIQAILERKEFDDKLNKEILHQIILALLDRLLAAPRFNHLYLASVHHEGLRNYLDYVRDQKVLMVPD